MARPAEPDKAPSATEKRRAEHRRINREAEEARELLLSFHRRGVSSTEIQRLTGITVKTITRWIERPQKHYQERTVRKAFLLQLGSENIDPLGVTSSRPEDVLRVYTAFDNMLAAGYSLSETARICGVQESTIRRIHKKGPEVQKRVHRKLLIAAERCENTLARRRKKSGRPRAPLPRIRGPHDVVGARSPAVVGDGAGDH